VNRSVGTFIEACQHRLNRLLDDYPAHDQGDGNAAARAELDEALRYPLVVGGKRIRPVLVYAAAQAIDPHQQPQGLDHAALAVELVHTYSLVHDDLPAMDDDDLRRGQPSLHRAWDEATAILVGDGLQAQAFELLAGAPGLSAGCRADMVATLARAAGPQGMVGGQFIDIRATDSDMGLADLSAMHALKTGALIRAALALGGIAAGAQEQQLQALDAYGRHVGLAFQVVDDILDVAGDTATLGKTRGKDDQANKPTYVKLMGLDGARREARELLGHALDNLAGFGDSADALRDLARYIVERDR